MRRLIAFLSFILIPGSWLLAQTTFDAANAAYAAGDYTSAATLYQQILDDELMANGQQLTADSRAVAFYNLGNAQFKQGELAQAILCYERALRLRPNYPDAQYNLAFARSRITDNIAEQDFFLSVWVRAVRNSLSENTWLILSIVLFILALAGILVFLLAHTPALRKTFFHIAWIALLFSLIAGLNAASLHRRHHIPARGHHVPE